MLCCGVLGVSLSHTPVAYIKILRHILDVVAPSRILYTNYSAPQALTFVHKE